MRNIRKKGVMGPVISVFVMVLVISILAGLTFLFVSAISTEAGEQSLQTTTVTGEDSAWINTTTPYYLDNAGVPGFRTTAASVVAYNDTNKALITTGNYTVSTDGVITGLSVHWGAVGFNYSFQSYGGTSYEAVNDTEAAGYTIVGYLPLIFLALIFGAILTLVLRMILPYINLGQKFGGF